jgi:hypothetical protein
MRKRLRKLSVVQTSTVAGVLYGLLGLLVVPFILTFGLFEGSEGMPFGIGGGLIGALVIPVGYGLLGFIGTAVACLLYNAIARITGGIEFEVEDLVG